MATIHRFVRHAERGTQPPLEWRSTLLADPCVYCGSRAENLDHIVPVAGGGEDGWRNRAPTCRSCNGHKGHTALLLFLLGHRTYGPINRPRREWRELPPPAPLTYTLADLARLSETLGAADDHG